MSTTFKSALAIASAAAALFAISAPINVAHADDMSVHCAGVNGCKGMGWNMKSSAQECTSAGGTVVK